MAIYHLEAKVISRSVGRSAVAAAAYMSCSKILNDYDGVQHDYTRKQGLVWQQIFLPEYAPKEWQDRSILWNAVEENEKSKDSRLAREFVVALPIELDKKQWISLLTDFIQNQFVQDGMCADVCIHDTDGHNPHAHIMLTVRPLDEQGKWQHKTEKEYLCIRNGEERGFTSAEYKAAQSDGWEKQYQYKVGRKKVYIPPSEAERYGYKRISKYPKSTKYGRQNPISARWNSDYQLVLWREAWADAVNRSLERNGIEGRIDHRSYAAQNIAEQPTIHEGVIAQALERKGIISERCELNRQIKADNTLLRELKAQVKNTIPAFADKMESLRENIIVFRYQVLHTLNDKRRIGNILGILQPKFTRYVSISGQIEEKSRERKTLLAEKKSTPILQILKHREIASRIAELIEELEELHSEKIQLLQSLGYGEDTSADEMRGDIATMETLHKQLGQQEQAYRAEFDSALKEYTRLKKRATKFDTAELMDERLAIRSSKERSAVSRMQSIYGNKYQTPMMYDSKRDVSDLLDEETESRSIRDRLRQKQQPQTQWQKKPRQHEQER